jgi:hypothetical protein
MQGREVLADLVPLIFPRTLTDANTQEVWDAWFAALTAAAPCFDKATAEQPVLSWALNKAARRDEGITARMRAVHILPTVLPPLRNDEQVWAQFCNQ